MVSGRSHDTHVGVRVAKNVLDWNDQVEVCLMTTSSWLDGILLC